MQWVCHNGFFLPAEQALFTASNRSFRYGDGLFETTKFYNGRLLLSSYHFERLFSGLKLLNIVPDFTADDIAAVILNLCERNCCTTLARVRIAVYRDANNKASYVIEAAALSSEKMQWSSEGWKLLLYPLARKSCDVFANLKSANFLPYVMAAQHVSEKGGDECLLLNMHNRICDGSKTNIFLLTGNDVVTPALSEGPVAGIMRHVIIDFFKRMGYGVHQKAVTEDNVLQAETVFLTNAIEGLRWVRQFKEREYGYGVLKKLYPDLLATITTL